MRAKIFTFVLPVAPALAWAFLAFLAFSSLPASAEPDLVLLVRHAERASEPQADPGLTPAGQARAQALAAALGQAGVNVIITTQFQRTRQTAAPLAAARGLTPEVVATRPGADHIADVVAAVRRSGGVVLVVGHSNTIPPIAAALSGMPAGPDFCETSFSHLWVVQGPRLATLRYGAADGVAPQGACQ